MNSIREANCGLYYTSYVENEKRHFAIYKHNVTDEISMEQCFSLFEECKEKNILQNESYEDNKWYGINPIDDGRITFDFNVEFSDEIIAVMKKYIIVKLGLCNFAISTVYENYRAVNRMLCNTQLLKDGYENEFADYVNRNKSILPSCRDFLSFITLKNAASYFKAINGIEPKVSKPRKILGYESVILLDVIIRDYIDNCDIEKRIKFYPIFIWWLISTIIPLRPTEVLMIKRNCVYKRKDRYYMHIDRIKNKAKRSKYKTPIMKEFEIPEEIYSFLSDYLDFINEVDEGTYLIPYKQYVKNVKEENKEKINEDHFRTLLNKFIKEVVEEQYHYEIVEIGCRTKDNQIERIKMGDTRHLAFINMMMQGFNPLYIQRIGGHYKLEEQLHYCSHLDTFATAKVYVLSKMLNDRISKNSIDMKDWGMIDSQKESLGLKFYSLPKVQDGAGRCVSQNVPDDCVCDECLFCQYFIPECNVSQKYIEEMQVKNQKNIAIKKETLKFLLNDAFQNEKEIDVVSKNLAALINQKLIIDAYTLNRGDVT